MKRQRTLITGVLASVLVLVGCSTSGGSSDPSSPGTPTTVTAATTPAAGSNTSTPPTTPDSPAASTPSEPVPVPTPETSPGRDWDALPTTKVALTDAGLRITDAGSYILSGTSSGQVIVDAKGHVRIVLDGVTIDSHIGAAIQIDNAASTVLELAEGTTNHVADAPTRADGRIDGAIYASDDLVITGTGALDVTANFADGIVGKDDLRISSGTIKVTSVDDGIRAKDSLTIDGGSITIDAADDGITSTNDTDLGRGQITITGGVLAITSGDDGITAEQRIWITGGTITIDAADEGIDAPVIVIDDGQITINAADDGINASASNIITTGLGITINGGDITILMAAGDADALDSNGDLTITGGTIDITARSPFDYDGIGTFTGGTITVNGQPVTHLTR